MDQDEHRIYQMFALSFHEHGKDHSLFVDNQNGVYHLKHFPFLSFTLREKNELFYKLKKKFFGEKCTYTFEPTSARKIHKTHYGGLINVFITIVTLAVVGFLFSNFDKTFDTHTTGDNVKSSLKTILSKYKNEIQTPSLDESTKNDIFKNIIDTGENSVGDKNAGVTILKIAKDKVSQNLKPDVQLKHLSGNESNILLTVLENSIAFQNSQDHNYGEYLKGNIKHNIIDKELEYFKERADGLSETNGENNAVAVIGQETPKEKAKKTYKDSDLYDYEGRWSPVKKGPNQIAVNLVVNKALDELIQSLNSMEITDTDIAKTIGRNNNFEKITFIDKRITKKLDEILFPSTNIINEHIPKQRKVVLLATIAPILVNVLSFIPMLSDSTLKKWVYIFTYTGLGSGMAYKNMMSGGLMATFVLYTLGSFAINRVLNSVAILYCPAYKYFKGSFIYRRRDNDGEERLQEVTNEYILHEENSLHTKFLPGNKITCSISGEKLWVVLAMYGENNEKRLIIQMDDLNKRGKQNLLKRIYSVDVKECSNNILHAWNNRLWNLDKKKIQGFLTSVYNNEQAIDYNGTLDQPYLQQTQTTMEEKYDLSIVFDYQGLYYRIEDNKIICLSDSKHDLDDILQISSRIDFGLNESYERACYTYIEYIISENRYIERKIEIQPSSGYYEYGVTHDNGTPIYTWEGETDKFNYKSAFI